MNEAIPIRKNVASNLLKIQLSETQIRRIARKSVIEPVTFAMLNGVSLIGGWVKLVG